MVLLNTLNDLLKDSDKLYFLKKYRNILSYEINVNTTEV